MLLRRFARLGAAVVLCSFTGSLSAQVAAPAAAAPAAAGVAAPPAAPPNNLWSFLCMTPEQKAACKQKFCASPLVGFFGAALAPARLLSGGLLPRCCPAPNEANPADLKKPADSAEGAAARIKEKEAQAKARRSAIRYLGTVDCRRYPEAEAALVNGLRADENECVRFEAALALGRGCCCTKKVMEALTDCVAGKKTNDPAETSPRVKLAAAAALERCCESYCEADEPKPPEKPPEDRSPAKPEPGSGDVQLTTASNDALFVEARRALARFRQTNAPRIQPTPEPSLAHVQGERSAAGSPVNDATSTNIGYAARLAATGTDRAPAALTQIASQEPVRPEERSTEEKPARRSRDLFSVFREAAKPR